MATNREVFEEIAPGWYNFRHWSIFTPELEEMAGLWGGGRLINLGCAHGPDFLPFRHNFDLYGIDFSENMIEGARKYARKFGFSARLTVSDITCLPFKDQSFDHAISIATYHHIRGDKERLKALAELYRVLKPDARAFITVWNRWQRRFWFQGKEVIVPWHRKGTTLERYYYLFTYPELEKLVRRAGFEILMSFPEHSYRYRCKYFSRNICLLIRRPGWTYP